MSPRCPCGAYTAYYASRIGHACAPGDPWPDKWKRAPRALRDEAILIRRAEGLTLEECGQEFGVSGETVRLIVAKSGIPICRKCKLPGELEPGRKMCHRCYQQQMNERPSKQAKRTGYRKSSRQKHNAWIVRLVNQGLTPEKIAERMGMLTSSVHTALYKMRKKGRDIQAADARKKRNKDT